MNILSVFDGISCGKVALRRAGIPVESYFASEIDKYAIAVSRYNHPEIVQLGDIRNWQSWQLPQIDMLIGGSPCQGFSSAGKGLNFEDERSKLFFVFVDILKALKPKYFLLENVRMKRQWQDIITQHIGIEPILIDSALLSAQSRKRLYWTNIPNVTIPEDKGLLLQDIIEDGFTERDKSYCVKSSYKPSLRSYLEKCKDQIVWKEFNCYSNRPVVVGSLTRYQNDSLLLTCGKSKTITAQGGGNGGNGGGLYLCDSTTWRKLTPIECERLQTLPDNYTQYGLFEDTVKPISNKPY